MTNLELKVKSLVEKTINDLGYRLYDVIYSKEGKENHLRIFIDNDKGISLDDCETVNNAITDMLDDADYIKEQYFLEISSPGIERLIRTDEHLKENIGNEIVVKLFEGINGEKEVKGVLESFDDEIINLDDKENNKLIMINRNNIALIKKYFNW